VVIQLPPHFIFRREREILTWGRVGGGILWMLYTFFIPVQICMFLLFCKLLPALL